MEIYVHCATANEINREKQNQPQILWYNCLGHAAVQMPPGKKIGMF